MRVLFTGDRDWDDFAIIRSVLVMLQPDSCCQGGARGADELVEIEAKFLHLPCATFNAGWATHGRAAGPIRNREMYNVFKPDIVVAFHDDLAKSKGTKDMINYAKKKGTPVWLVSH